MQKAVLAIIVIIAIITAWFMGTLEESLPKDPEPQKKNSKNTPKAKHNNPKLTNLRFKKIKARVIGNSTAEIFDAAKGSKPEKDVILEGEKVLGFKTKEELLRFLKEAKRLGIDVTGIISQLNAVRIKFRDPRLLSKLLEQFPDLQLVGENPTVNVPKPIGSSSYSGFGFDTLKWLGVTDNKGWGKGIKVAFVDTGISSHPAFEGKFIQRFNMLEDDGSVTSGHGTSVASLIAGDSLFAKGISPDVQLMDFRALDGNGVGDSFTIAKAIVEAVDNGAKIINLSLGSPSGSFAMQQAVNYARQNGVYLIASVGNDGQGQISYPAKYDGVIAVSAVDKKENYLDFANRGEEVDISAPGLNIIAADLDGRHSYFSGTSASAPLVSGTLAMLLSEYPNASEEYILNALFHNANDVGEPSHDPLYGDGILNVKRIEDKDVPGIYDFAASGVDVRQSVDNPDDVIITFTGENRGTEELQNTKLKLSIGGQVEEVSFSNVVVGQTVHYTLKVKMDDLRKSNGVITVSGDVLGSTDTNIANNIKTLQLSLPEEDAEE